MNNPIILMILLQAVLIGLNAVFACAEIAVLSVNDTKLAKLAAQGDKRAVRLARLTSEPARFLATIQVAITLSGFLGSAFAAENFSDGLVNWLISLGVTLPRATLDAAAVVFITLVLSYFTLIFGELVPKRVAMRKAEPLALGISALISAIAKLFAPIVNLLTASTNGVLRFIGIDPNEQEEEVSEEEIRMMVDAGSEKGVIDPAEKEFIQNVFEFDDLTAGEIVTHRTELSILYLEESMEEWENTIHNSRHTLYPVCDESADCVVGILNAKDYFRMEDKTREQVMKKAVGPAYFVPESVRADVLFRNMKHTHNKIAVVLDEYGGMSGIVTMNDLVEQLVGDLGDDEVQPEQEKMRKIDEDIWEISGDVSLEQASKQWNIELPQQEYDTFNGLIFDALGTIPKDGSVLEMETADLQIKITEIKEHQVKKALVQVKKPVESQ